MRAVGTLEFDEADELPPLSRSSLIFLLSSAVRLAVPFAAKKFASWELTSPGEDVLISPFAMLVLGVLVGILSIKPVSR